MKRIFIGLCFVLASSLISAQSNRPFITEWSHLDTIVVIPTSKGAIDYTTNPMEQFNYTYNYNVKYYIKHDSVQTVGFHTARVENDTIPTASYNTNDTLVVEISGVFPHFYIHYQRAAQLTTIVQWGDIAWLDFNSSFYGCVNMKYTATDIPDLRNVENFYNAFNYTPQFNGDLSQWDVSNVKNMYCMFSGASSFNSDLSNWDVSNAKDLGGMFFGASTFNSDLSQWNVSNVENMVALFRGVTNFTSDLSSWNTSKVTSMAYMFSGCIYFNSDLSNWDVSNVKQAHAMFQNASNFESDLSKWNVSYITNANLMFQNAMNFNSDLSKWDVRNMQGMEFLFEGATQFNCDLSNWDIQNAIGTTNLFKNTSMSYCNLDATLNAWKPVLDTSSFIIGEVPAASSNSAATRAMLDTRITVVTEVTNPAGRPSISVSKTDEFCIGDQITLTASSTDSVSYYKWDDFSVGSTIMYTLQQDTLITVIGFDSLECRSYASIQVNVEDCLSIDENISQFQVFPNPATDYVTIVAYNLDFSKTTISLMDLTGKTLLQDFITTINTTLSIGDLPTGIYLMKVQDGDKIQLKKIVKY